MDLSRHPAQIVRVGLLVAVGFALTTGVAGALSPGGFRPRSDRAGADPARQLHHLAVTYLPPLQEPAPPATNEDKARIELGRRLFFEPALSVNRSLSCNTCHPLDQFGSGVGAANGAVGKGCNMCHMMDRFGMDGKRTSPGHDGRSGRRNSPSVYNAALHVAQFWDGRAASLEEQAGMSIINPEEMGMPDRVAVEARLREAGTYGDLFGAAFPGGGPVITFENATRAIAAFERTLVTPSRYDRYAAGDLGALTPTELRGLSNFLELGCSPCHSGDSAGGKMYEPFGIFARYWELTGSPVPDEGRGAVTGKPADRHYFKVPSLRNVARTAPYFHDGSVDRLEDAVRIMGRAQLGLILTDTQVGEIVAFLRTLGG
ncbi:MAG: cytochrome c peroxidase [Kiritimatiellia bacterium]